MTDEVQRQLNEADAEREKSRTRRENCAREIESAEKTLQRLERRQAKLKHQPSIPPADSSSDDANGQPSAASDNVHSDDSL
jgi:hypothetical protein